MALAAVVGLASFAGGLISGKSPRFGGGDGPLYSTVNGFIDKIVAGDLGVIQTLNTLRVTGGERSGTKGNWQLFWDQMVPIQPLTKAQVDLIQRLDPTKTAIVSRSGPPIYADPRVPAPTLEQVLAGIAKVVAPTATPSGASPNPDLSAVARNPLPSVASMPLWMLVLLGGGAAWFVYKLVKKG